MRDVCLPLAAQRGQALIESVLLLSLLTLLLHAALGLGRAQLAAMQLGNSSRKAAMTAARGQAMLRTVRAHMDDADAQRRVGAGACRGGGYRRFRRNARAPWVNCWRRPSPRGRPALSMDWLAAWHDVATADSLFADGGGREVTPVPVLCHIVLTGRCTRGVTLRLRG